MMVTKNINVSGGDLPSEYKAKIKLTIDYTGATVEELIPRATRSDVITLQAKYRKMTTAELNKMAETGVIVKSKDVTSTTIVNVETVLRNLGYDDATIKLILENKDLAVQMMNQAEEA